MSLKKSTVAIAVKAKPGLKFFRRSGVRFDERTETVVVLKDMSKEQVDAICHEPMLHWRELSEVPKARTTLVHLSREQLEDENMKLKERVAELEEEMAYYEPEDDDDFDSMNVADLRNLCGTRGIPYSGLNRTELLAALRGEGDDDGDGEGDDDGDGDGDDEDNDK